MTKKEHDIITMLIIIFDVITGSLQSINVSVLKLLSIVYVLFDIKYITIN